jgi:hypothetical protein
VKMCEKGVSGGDVSSFVDGVEVLLSTRITSSNLEYFLLCMIPRSLW